MRPKYQIIDDQPIETRKAVARATSQHGVRSARQLMDLPNPKTMTVVRNDDIRDQYQVEVKTVIDLMTQIGTITNETFTEEDLVVVEFVIDHQTVARFDIDPNRASWVNYGLITRLMLG